MPYCSPEQLEDLVNTLSEVRSWEGVIEKKAGIFYLQREPFLHFHLVEGGRRRADVKGRAGWIQIDLPQPVSATRRRTFLHELRMRYRERQHSSRRTHHGE